MCHSIYISTTSPEDLAALPSSLFCFQSDPSLDKEIKVGFPGNRYRWHLLGRYGGCSCHFRHLAAGSDFEFGVPEAWSPEDADDIESTLAAYDVFARIVASGNELEVVDLWEGTSPENVIAMEVSLSHVPRESFQFFEGYKFILRP